MTSTHTDDEIAAAVARAVDMTGLLAETGAETVAGGGAGGAGAAGSGASAPAVAAPYLFKTPFELIDTAEGVARVVDAVQGAWDSHLVARPDYPFVVGVDLEGMNDTDPSTENRCTLLTLAVPRGFNPLTGARLPPYVVLVDLLALSDRGLDMPGVAHPGCTLRSLLTHESVLKALWDVRFDLFTLSQGHGLLLPKASLVDLQVLCLWKLKSRKEFLFGLGPQTLRDLLPGHPDVRRFARGGPMDVVDERAKKLWKDRAPYTGSIAVWRERPIPHRLYVLLEYAAQDGTYLLDLFDAMVGGLSHPLVVAETSQRWEASVVSTWRNTREHARNPAIRWEW